MKKKLSLWGAVCLIFVCLMQMTVSAAGNVAINQCIISGANQVTVVATTVSNVPSDDNNYYLFALQPYETAIGARINYCAVAAKAGVVTMATSFEITNKDELNRIIERIRNIESVIDIERTTG